MCPEKNGLHLAEDNILLEVLDPHTLEPVPDGQPGEMVLTTLLKAARPMIRFRTGDIVTRFPDECPCGRTFSRFVVQGRIDDMFIVSGVNVFPSDVEHVVRGIQDLNGEYRVSVYTHEHLTRFDVEVEAVGFHEDGGSAIAQQIANQIKFRTGVRPENVKVLAPDTLPRATHKAKRLVNRQAAEEILKGAGI
jgi:phenylacetate-CoA ligase